MVIKKAPAKATPAKKAAPSKRAAEQDQPDSPIPGAVAFSVDKPVNLEQLEAEISAATGAQVTVALVGAPDGQAPLDAGNVATLWVIPASASASLVQQALDDHSADSGWGIPQVIQELNEIWALLSASPELILTQEQQLKLLRGLAFRVMGGPRTAPAE